MQVKASKKTMLAFTILAAAMAFVVLVHMGTTLWKTRGYERVQGQILGVDDFYIRRDSGDSTVVHKIYFSYRVGESEYSDFYEDLTRWGAKAGKKITVHYDPAAPERNRKPMTTEIVVFLGVAVLTLAFAAMTRKAE